MSTWNCSQQLIQLHSGPLSQAVSLYLANRRETRVVHRSFHPIDSQVALQRSLRRVQHKQEEEEEEEEEIYGRKGHREKREKELTIDYVVDGR